MSALKFGPRLAQLRRRRGLSQQQLADALCAAAGAPTLSRNEISRWERGIRLPAQPWLGWLALVLNVPADDLALAHARPPPRSEAVGRSHTGDAAGRGGSGDVAGRGGSGDVAGRGGGGAREGKARQRWHALRGQMQARRAKLPRPAVWPVPPID